ncbi:MAG: Rrf2 family transcriptional regulator [Candidatus Omnitrophica bacterium]|nr:Rrf2 family transcriptional regulator [Candidatus Omnitrophota bacterium]
MFKMNRKIGYALISLKHMRRKAPGQLTSAKEICDMYHTPFDPTSRCLQLMAQAGILRAEQGAHGGYQILKDLSKVSLKDLSEIIAGPIRLANCLQGKSQQCELTKSCNVISPILILNEKINKLFKTTRIIDLVEGRHQAEKAIKDGKTTG